MNFILSVMLIVGYIAVFVVVPAMIGVFVGGSPERIAWTVSITAFIVSAFWNACIEIVKK